MKESTQQAHLTFIICMLFTLTLGLSNFSLNASESQNNGKMAVNAEEKINIKTATVKQLMQVKGIGKKRAEVIIKYLKSNENVNSMDDLKAIKGVGGKTLERMKEKFVIK